MKQININDFIYKNDLNIKDRMEVLGMEFIKVGKNYMIKNANGRIVSEKEKLQLENKELVLEDIKSNGCQGKTTKKISKNKKRIAEIEEQDANKSKAE
jgi:uncharacterized protein (UPF0335 family)